MNFSPIKEVAGFDARAASFEISAGETLVRPRAPAAVIRTHLVTHHPLLNCEEKSCTRIKKNKKKTRSLSMLQIQAFWKHNVSLKSLWLCIILCVCASALPAACPAVRVNIGIPYTSAFKEHHEPELWTPFFPPQSNRNNQCPSSDSPSPPSSEWHTHPQECRLVGTGPSVNSRAVNGRPWVASNEEACVRCHRSISNTHTLNSLTG